MGKKNKDKQKKGIISRVPVKNQKKDTILPWTWVLAVIVITAICFFPMLRNGFTNWDDPFYVIQNALLRGPDWKGIFSTPVVSNYHPITIISLALNYQVSQLDPTSYLVVNYILHLINTALVFYLIWIISGKKTWVAFISALLFGIHPMHVESVAWVSERKDLLYTLFFLSGMIQYWRYLVNEKKTNLWICFLFFGLSIMSKPAAIIFPVVLLLLDYWKGRPIKWKTILEKIPFFLVALVFAIITLKIQSKTAIAGLDMFPLWTRPFFASHAVMIYFIRFFIPYPLSAFHPYPSPDDLGLPVLLSPLFIIALLAAVWYYRRNKLVVFCFLFFIVNLLLVIQIVSIGNTLVAERYTYVPYISLAFLFSMLVSRFKPLPPKVITWFVPAVISVAFGIMTYQHTKVWKDSASLWTNVINQYPNAPVPRTNRANNTLKIIADPAFKEKADELLQQALEDCTIAIKYKPDHAKGYENRQNIYLRLNKDSLALADASSLIKLEPGNKLGYFTRGMAYFRLNQPEKSLDDYNKSLAIDPNSAFALDARGSLLYNFYQNYKEAITDFNKAIQISPLGNSYLNRSKCYYQLGEMEKAKADAIMAIQKGVTVPDSYRQLLNLNN